MFWILVYKQPLHMPDADRVNEQGQEFERGDMVVAGHFYKQFDRKKASMFLQKSQPSFIAT